MSEQQSGPSTGGGPRRELPGGDALAGRITRVVMAFVIALIVGAVVGYGLGSRQNQGPAGGGASGTTGGADPQSRAAPSPRDAAPESAEASTDAANPYADFRIAEFSLTDRAGRPVGESLFDGEVTVLTFFFTSCNGPCPAIARVMKDIQARTARGAASGLRLASISVDGERDTPEVIGSFADSYGADPERWTFLTGDPAAVRELVAASIDFEVREQEDVELTGPGGAAMHNILHPTRLLLVGPDRRLIGIYAFNDAEQVEGLIAAAAAALD